MIEVKPFEEKDALLLLKDFDPLFKVEVDVFLSGSESFDDFVLQNLATAETIWSMWEDDKLLLIGGFGNIRGDRSVCALLRTTVKPKNTKEFIEKLKIYMDKRPTPIVENWIWDGNRPSLRLVEYLGFKQVGHIDNFNGFNYRFTHVVSEKN